MLDEKGAPRGVPFFSLQPCGLRISGIYFALKLRDAEKHSISGRLFKKFQMRGVKKRGMRRTPQLTSAEDDMADGAFSTTC